MLKRELPVRSGLGIHMDSDPVNENFLQKLSGAAATPPAWAGQRLWKGYAAAPRLVLCF